MHVFPVADVTKSGIRIRVWLEQVAGLLEFEDRRNCPAFYNEEGYKLEVRKVEKVFHPILRSIQRDVNLPDLIPSSNGSFSASGVAAQFTGALLADRLIML